MPKEKIQLLLTRPAEAAADFARSMPNELSQKLSIIHTPLTKYELLKGNDIGFLLGHKKYDALMFSSSYGVKAFYDVASGLQKIPSMAFTVGDDTARQLAFSSHSFENEHYTAEGDMESLLSLIASRNSGYQILYPCARDLSPNTVPLIEKSPLKIDMAPIYQMVKVDSSGFNKALADLSGRVVVPFFSARSAQIFAQFLGADADKAALKNMIAVSLSQNIQKQISHLPWREMLCCFKPGRKEMYSAINIACESF